jgi:hypothetical protein
MFWPLCGGGPGTTRLPITKAPVHEKSFRRSRRRLHNPLVLPSAEVNASLRTPTTQLAAHASSPWWLLHVPLRDLVDISNGVDEIVFVTGDALRSWCTWPLRLVALTLPVTLLLPMTLLLPVTLLVTRRGAALVAHMAAPALAR